MFSFWTSPPVGGGGGVNFSSTIEVLNGDNTVTIRPMNPDGGYYDAEMEVYDDDEGSLSYRMAEDDDEDMSFLDAVQDNVPEPTAPDALLTPDSPALSTGSDYFRSGG